MTAPQKDKGPATPSWASTLIKASLAREDALLRYENERRVAKGIWQMCLVLGAIIALGWWLS